MNPHAATRIKEASEAYLSLARGGDDDLSPFFSGDYTVHLTGSTMTGGHGLIHSAAARLGNAFSDLVVEIEFLLQEGTKATWQRTFTGFQTGSYFGFPASGRTVVWREMVVTRFDGSLIAEEWIVSDLAERLLSSRKQKSR